ncbi:MAG: 4-hydroxy-tetrahydrodipicolinate reductase [Bacteroidota bacterium]
MKIGLLGYGRMGKAVEEEAKARGHEIMYAIDMGMDEAYEEMLQNPPEVVIEFTHPDSFEENFQKLMEAGIPMVAGTTGWYDQIEEIKAEVERKEGSFMYASNFSVGVNLMFKLNQILAKFMNDYPEYDCFIEERHHKFKKDAPSGTAIALGNQVLGKLDRKTKLAHEELVSRAPEEEELSVGFVRSAGIRGTHEVTYVSDIDSLTIRHEAYSRRGFALGAVIAAEWLAGKKGFYSFSDIFEG